MRPSAIALEKEVESSTITTTCTTLADPVTYAPKMDISLSAHGCVATSIDWEESVWLAAVREMSLSPHPAELRGTFSP